MALVKKTRLYQITHNKYITNITPNPKSFQITHIMQIPHITHITHISKTKTKNKKIVFLLEPHTSHAVHLTLGLS